MKYLIIVALFAFAAAQDEGEREFPVFNRTCSVRSAEIRPNVKTAFNTAAVSVNESRKKPQDRESWPR
jgi:hypothetical protein